MKDYFISKHSFVLGVTFKWNEPSLYTKYANLLPFKEIYFNIIKRMYCKSPNHSFVELPNTFPLASIRLRIYISRSFSNRMIATQKYWCKRMFGVPMMHDTNVYQIFTALLVCIWNAILGWRVFCYDVFIYFAVVYKFSYDLYEIGNTYDCHPPSFFTTLFASR